jgi:chromosome segregation ATPase
VTIADLTAAEPSFTVERFEPVGERLEVTGHWQGVRGRRFVRPVLWLHAGESRRRLIAVLDHKPWAAGDGDAWVAAFAWGGGKVEADRAELEVGSDLVVELPVPGGKAVAEPRRAHPRRPSELERVREQLAAETRERRELQHALDGVRREAETLASVRAERDAAREDADRARTDGERLVNDEYRQRERAEAAADEATAARDLAERQLAVARERYGELEARATAAEAARDRAVAARDAVLAERDAAIAARDRLAAERDDAVAARDVLAADRVDSAGARTRLEAERNEAVTARDRLAAARDRMAAESEALRSELAAANEDRDRLRAELAVPAAAPPDPARSERLEAELAGAWAQHERLAAELDAARTGRERVEAELVAVRAERKRLERELAERERSEHRPLRRQTAAPPGPPSRIAPPRSGPALWTVRAVALALVVLLLIAIALVVGRVV